MCSSYRFGDDYVLYLEGQVRNVVVLHLCFVLFGFFVGWFLFVCRFEGTRWIQVVFSEGFVYP